MATPDPPTAEPRTPFADCGAIMAAGVCGAVVGYWWLSPILAIAALGGVLVVYAMLIVAWFQGSSIGRRFLRKAEQREARAISEAARANATATKAQQSAAEATAEKESALLMARRANFAAIAKITDNDPVAIQSIVKLPLELRVSASVRIGRFPDEPQEAYERRRQSIVEERTREWTFRRSYNHRLLPLVEAQGGLCGDPSKDHMGKGCGCSLFALHPSTVDIDHIRPRSRGGDDSTQNLQALCTMCNRKAGATYWEPGEAPRP